MRILMSQSPSGSSGRTARRLGEPNAPIAAMNNRGKLTCYAYLSGCEKYKALLFTKDLAKLQLKQSQITVLVLGPITYKALQLKYAIAVYIGGLLFNHYEQEYIKAAIKATYLRLTLPNYKDLIGVLLIGKYTTFLVITIENSILTYG